MSTHGGLLGGGEGDGGGGIGKEGGGGVGEDEETAQCMQCGMWSSTEFIFCDNCGC